MKRNEQELNHPRYIDPLYRPYHINYNNSFTTPVPSLDSNTRVVKDIPIKSPIINTHYPIVDPYRRHLDKGLTFRSNHEIYYKSGKSIGYCPPGWKMSRHGYCKLEEPESWGTFYTSDSWSKTPLQDVNGYRAYNRDAGVIENGISRNALIANGHDDVNRAISERCHNANFW